MLISIHLTGQIKNKKNHFPEKNFFQIQKEFYKKWEHYHVVNGYYFKNGKKIRANGWKQFKRWEWYWENRVDPQTGAFPDTSQMVSNTHKISKSYSITATNGNWTSLGPSSSSGGYEGIGRINCIAFHPSDNNTYWVGSPSGGLWVSNDNGNTWTTLTDNNEVLGVSTIAVSPDYSTSHIIYIGTGDRDGGALWNLSGGQHNDNNGVGVLKSTDGGTTWNPTGLTYNEFEYVTVNRILINPDRYNTVLAATSYGIYISYDGGDNWNNSNWDNMIDMEYNPNDTSVIYTATKNSWGSPVIYKTTDGGASWNIIKTFGSSDSRVEIAVTPNDPNYLYAVVCKSDNSLSGVYRSTNQGVNINLVYDGTLSNHNLLGWKTDGSDAGGQGKYDLALAVSPSDKNTLFLGGINTHKSIDGGTSWTAVSCWTTSTTYNKNGAPEVHADHHTLHFRSSDNALFDGNDGGIYLTSNGGTSWTDKTNGIIISQMYRLGLSNMNVSEIITGLQDNGTKTYTSGNWNDVKGGDGMECIIDYTNDNIQYASAPNGDIARTTDNWNSVTNITQNMGSPINGLTETGSWVTPYVLDPTNHQTIYLGLENVWKSNNSGDSWTKISSINSTSKLRSIAVYASNSQVIYTASQDAIWKTLDGGTSWGNVTGNLPVDAAHITYIAIKHNDSATVWVSMGEYDNNGIYYTANGGSSWSNISTGLPPVPVMCIVENKQNTSQTELYAATDAGIYSKVGAANWFSFSSGLPNVVVSELEIYYDTQASNSKLRAATYGRGLWESSLFSPPTSVPDADFSANDTTPDINTTVSFTDKSTNVPTSWIWNFVPNTVSYINGTSSTSENPEVQFNGIGSYTAILTAINNVGNNTETKTDYIVAGYCTANGWAGSSSYIKSVVLLDIQNENTGSDGYANYSNLSTDLKFGNTYFLTITNGGSNQDDDLGAWIDWNEDGNFSGANEQIVCSINNYGQGTFSFQVPSGTSYGSKRMRIRIKTSGSNCGSYCGDAYEGEVEDYTVNVTRKTNTWLGTKDNDWFNTANWTLGAVPTFDNNVVIPSAPSGNVFPEIQAGNTAQCNKLTLQTGAQITINGTLNVTVSGN